MSVTKRALFSDLVVKLMDDSLVDDYDADKHKEYMEQYDAAVDDSALPVQETNVAKTIAGVHDIALNLMRINKKPYYLYDTRRWAEHLYEVAEIYYEVGTLWEQRKKESVG